MKVQTLSVSRDTIRQTNAFKSLSRMLQNITLNRRNIQAIENGVNVSENIGFQNWERQTQASYANREIIKELLNLRS